MKLALNKRTNSKEQSLESYCSCFCSCGCPSLCGCSPGGHVAATGYRPGSYSTNSSRGHAHRAAAPS